MVAELRITTCVGMLVVFQTTAKLFGEGKCVWLLIKSGHTRYDFEIWFLSYSEFR